MPSLSIESRSARERLPARREPYWLRLQAGGFLGYRKLAEGEGTWIARWRDEDGKQRYLSLGEVLDDGKRPAVDIASARAREWFSSLAIGVATEVKTVRDACVDYVNAVRADPEQGPDKAEEIEARLKRLVYADAIARFELTELRRAHVAAWRERLGARPAKVSRSARKATVTRQRSLATINRDIVPLRAALNRAHQHMHVATDLAWAEALKPIKNADRRRDIYLDRQQRRALLDKADAEVAPFVKALALLPLRPGALAALTVADFDFRRKTLRVGRDKDGGERRIPLPALTADFLQDQAKDKLPGAPLVGRRDGRFWDKDGWKRPIRDAVLAAELPKGTTAYTLRHSTITDLVSESELDLLTIARLSGTSVAMIEKHYGHLREKRAAQGLATLVL